MRKECNNFIGEQQQQAAGPLEKGHGPNYTSMKK